MSCARLHDRQPGPATGRVLTAATARLGAALERPDRDAQPPGYDRGAFGWYYAIARATAARGARSSGLDRFGGDGLAAAAESADAVRAGLAAAAMLSWPAVPAVGLHAIVRRAVERAAPGLRTGSAVPAVPDDSLLRGSLGLAELLSTAGRVLDDDRCRAAAARFVRDTAARVLGGRAVTAAPGGTWTPGLFLGAAGIGHGLLRAAAPEQVPSVLVLT